MKWNAPAFFYTGEIKPFSPKEYKRHIVVFNVAKNKILRLVFISGAMLNDTAGLLEETTLMAGGLHSLIVLVK